MNSFQHRVKQKMKAEIRPGTASGSTTNAPGYAISINHALSVVKEIAALHASALVHIGATAFIGVNVQTTTQGVTIANVIPGSPAENSGLASGDLVTSVDGTPVANLNDLRAILFKHHPTDSITIAYTDPLGNAATATIVLASGPPQ